MWTLLDRIQLAEMHRLCQNGSDCTKRRLRNFFFLIH
ncbi:hypothetical protein T4D_16926 [Trichinella pseudospiralis]|uniref:Uncharacterized protein n=1 Tax=Trichinella pseudospiralis TaxID=6337 RepID=A0A0V1F6T0_TRIPS|nr:hypothetical protein T4D_16926 [Trichinella pseudospiralis]